MTAAGLASIHFSKGVTVDDFARLIRAFAVGGSKAQDVVQQIKDSGGIAEYWHLDVSNEKEVEKVISEVHARLGGINVLVNNAGIAGVNKPTHEMSEGEWDTVMETSFGADCIHCGLPSGARGVNGVC